MELSKSIEEFFDKQTTYADQLQELRSLVLSADMKETLKWGMPVYTVDGKNVVGLSSFKGYYGLWFFQGVFLSDPYQVLSNAQEGKTKAMRHWRFEDDDQLDHDKIMEYLLEAVDNQKKGLMVKPETKKTLVIPAELTEAFKKDEQLEANFEHFTLTKKREFAEYIDQAKREETRLKRLEKIIPMINEHIGLNDKYRK